MIKAHRLPLPSPPPSPERPASTESGAVSSGAGSGAGAGGSEAAAAAGGAVATAKAEGGTEGSAATATGAGAGAVESASAAVAASSSSSSLTVAGCAVVPGGLSGGSVAGVESLVAREEVLQGRANELRGGDYLQKLLDIGEPVKQPPALATSSSPSPPAPCQRALGTRHKSWQTTRDERFFSCIT